MLRSLNDLERYQVNATDGAIGHAVNFLFDDEQWAVRYLVVETKGFVDGRQVLISPISIADAQWPRKLIQLTLTKDKVKHSPSVDLHQPVSRQQEILQNRYYGYPAYWGYTGGIWGLGPYPALLRSGDALEGQRPAPSQPSGDVHLRSAQEVRGYRIEGSDGAIGHVADLIVDDEDWAIRYLVVDAGDWWVGSRKVVIAPQWATRFDWAEQAVHVALSRQAIKDSPPWPGPGAVNRQHEALLYEYYGRPPYWGIRESSDVAVRTIPAPPAP